MDGFSLLLFGGHYVTDKPLVEAMCSLELYLARVKERLQAPALDESVRTAMSKMFNGVYWPEVVTWPEVATADGAPSRREEQVP